MRIAEIYDSRQGEGLLTGTPSVFVRTSGCNLRCEFCDTHFTSWEPSGGQLSLPEIVASVAQFEIQHVVITGGEPMLSRDIGPLTKLLKVLDKHITIETAGTRFREVECDLMSISPKLSNSTPEFKRAGEWQAKHEATRKRPCVINQLIQRYEYQLKYVVGSQGDIEEIQQHLDQLESWSRERVLLMPEGIDQRQLIERQAWLEPICKQLGFRFCPRKHIEWYGNRRGT